MTGCGIGLAALHYAQLIHHGVEGVTGSSLGAAPAFSGSLTLFA